MRANSPDPLRARLDAMYVEERRIDALLRAKQDDFLSAFDQLQVAETDSAAEEVAPQKHLESRYSSRCSLAFQEEADQTFEECQANSNRFWREEREWQLRSARGGDEGAHVPRDQSPQRYCPSPAGTPSSAFASFAAPSEYYSSQDARSDAPFYEELQ